MSAPTITEKYPPFELRTLVGMLHTYKQANLEIKRDILAALIAKHAFLSAVWGGDWKYRRARKISASDSIKDVKAILWPPSNLASSGRANVIGMPVMYLADRLETALQEVRHGKGKILLSEFKIQDKKSVDVLPIGELSVIQKTGNGRLLTKNGETLNSFFNACDHEEAQA